MGIAYLHDGTRLDYSDYLKHPHWKKVRQARLEFDNNQCVVCHKALSKDFETHHLCYDRLGRERIRDVVTLCSQCHTAFHAVWTKQSFWKGREPSHWETYDFEHTAAMCLMYYKEDRFICRDTNAPNLCNRDTCRQYVDEYCKTLNEQIAIIDPNDLQLFVRNKRYELYFEYEARGKSVEEFLDDFYGPKVRGKNPLRVEAGKKNGTFDHEPKSFRQHYKENKNINQLMKRVEEMEKENEKT